MNTLCTRFTDLSDERSTKIDVAQECADLTIPSVFVGDRDYNILPETYSSLQGRGVTSLAARMLSGIVPLNDAPFFTFGLASGETPDEETQSQINDVIAAVYRRILSGNIREAIYDLLINDIVVGDCLFQAHDNFSYSTIQLNNYVVEYKNDDTLCEIIVRSWDVLDDSEETTELYTQYKLDHTTGIWKVTIETKDGESVTPEVPQYTVLPLAHVRWRTIPGEPYGCSHVENLRGDLRSLEAYTKGHLQGLAASCVFWMVVNPTGRTDIDDISSAPSGEWVSGDPSDIACVSPASTVKPQVAASQLAVDTLRKEIATAFLMMGQSLPSGERVTATAIRAIASEIESETGGGFSSFTRQALPMIVKRALIVMFEDGTLDESLKQLFFDEDEDLIVQIVTGLQALSRETELNKLLQLGEIQGRLQGQNTRFNWDKWNRAVINAMGYSEKDWFDNQAGENSAQNPQIQMIQQMLEKIPPETLQNLLQGLMGSAANATTPEIINQ